jgi:transposase InsO family protein
MTFLRNHRDVISGVNSMVVPTIRFELLYVWFVIGDGRRRVLHVNVTAHHTSAWVVQQPREALSDGTSTRCPIHDNDSIFSDRVIDWIQQLGIEPKATALGSPWQNGLAERWIGTIRRELIDHVVPIDEEHLRRISDSSGVFRTTDTSRSDNQAPAGEKTALCGNPIRLPDFPGGFLGA